MLRGAEPAAHLRRPGPEQMAAVLRQLGLPLQGLCALTSSELPWGHAAMGRTGLPT